MSDKHEDAERRVKLLYTEYFNDDNNADEFEIEGARQRLIDLLSEFEVCASDRKKDLSESSRTRLLSMAAFMRICISDTEDATIYKYREEKGWKQRDIDAAMLASLHHSLTLADKKEASPKLEFGGIEFGDYEQMDLYDLIRKKIDRGGIPAGYAGQLLLLLQKVQVPPNYSTDLIDITRQQAAGRLRHDTRTYKPDPDTDPVVKVGLDYINKLVGLSFKGIRTISSLALEEPVKSGDMGLGMKENKQRIETLIAYALDELYPSTDIAGRDLDVS